MPAATFALRSDSACDRAAVTAGLRCRRRAPALRLATSFSSASMRWPSAASTAASAGLAGAARGRRRCRRHRLAQLVEIGRAPPSARPASGGILLVGLVEARADVGDRAAADFGRVGGLGRRIVGGGVRPAAAPSAPCFTAAIWPARSELFCSSAATWFFSAAISFGGQVARQHAAVEPAAGRARRGSAPR